MDPNLKNYLDKHKIYYKEYFHPAVFTVNESKNIKIDIPAVHTKCLFLKDNNKNYYLIAIKADKRLDIKSLKRLFNLKELSFGTPEELKEKLNLTPGSVSIFGLIYSKDILFIIDSELWTSDFVGFHPNINTSTIVLDNQNLKKYISSLSIKIQVLDI